MDVIEHIRAHAERDPRHPAILAASPGTGDDACVGYARLVERFDALATALREGGVSAGDRCGMIAPQGSDFVEMALAILAAGACLVPIPDDHAGAVLGAFADRAHLHHLVVHAATAAARDEQLVRRASAISARLPAATIAATAEAPGGTSDTAGGSWLHTAFERVVPVDASGDESFRSLGPAYMRFTSGTTSERKGVVIGHRAILERLAAANRGLGIGPPDRILWLLPMAHHFVVSILLYLRYGATILLPSSSLAAAVLDLARRARATVFYASPHHLNLLAKDASGAELPDVRLVVSTADGLRAEIAHAFVARYGHAVVQALGIIEVGLPVMNSASARTKPTALGRPLPDYRVELRDEEGRVVEQRAGIESTGEICIHGPGLFDAYLEPWTLAATLTAGTGFRTGDQGRIDDDGDLHLVGRRTNRINMAGMKFFSEEVEAVLDAHPAVARSRVRPREHPHLGDVPVAEIVLHPGAATPDRKTLVAFCRERLPAYKIPREFTTVEELPLTPTGKIRRGD